MTNAEIVAELKEIAVDLERLQTRFRATRAVWRPTGTRAARYAVQLEHALRQAEPPLIFLRAALESETEAEYLRARLAEVEART